MFPRHLNGCALSRNGIVGPYFFQDDNRALPFDSVRYMTMIQDSFLPELDEFELKDWQDCVTAYKAWTFQEQGSPTHYLFMRRLELASEFS